MPGPIASRSRWSFGCHTRPTHSTRKVAVRTLASAIVVFGLTGPLRADDLTDALTAGRFADVVQLADARLKTAPRDARVWTIRGIALERLQRLPESLQSFERALAIDPDSIAALQGATEAAYLARNAKATALVTRVLARDPSSETAHAMAGVLAVEAGRCEQGVGHFRQSGSAIAGNAVALTQFGGCLLRLHKPDDAIAVFERLLREGGDNPEVRYNLAVASLEAGRSEEAMANARVALAASPRDPEVLSLFAAASAAAGQVEPAITALRSAIDVAPRDERHYLDLAVICLDHDNADLAMEVVNAGLARIPDAPRLFTMRGAIHADRAELEQAVQDFERARALGPDELYGAVGLSLVLRQTDRIAEAIALLRQKLARRPTDPTLNYLLADALLRSDPDPASAESRQARKALTLALRANPSFASAHAALGKLLLRAGELPAAVEALQAAVRLDSSNRVALNQLVLAYRQLGRASEAAAAAAELKALLVRERAEEVARNRVRLVKSSPSPAVRHD
jgi:tetratricopeptide (TPR) repeat protein